MKHSPLSPSGLLLLVLLATLPCARAAGDDTGVRQANAAFYAALNTMFTGDVAPMLEVWSHADDITYMGPGGGYEVGWTAIKPIWEQQAAKKLGGKVEPAEIQVQASDTLAVVSCMEKGTNTNVNGQEVTVSLRATSIYRKEGGTWKMIGHHTDIIPGL